MILNFTAWTLKITAEVKPYNMKLWPLVLEPIRSVISSFSLHFINGLSLWNHGNIANDGKCNNEKVR